jgi:hypothetical protein
MKLLKLIFMLGVIGIEPKFSFSQSKSFDMVFEHTFKNEQVIVYSGKDTLFNKRIITDESTGTADVLEAKRFKNSFIYIQINRAKQKIYLLNTLYFGVRYSNKRIQVVRYKKRRIYD